MKSRNSTNRGTFRSVVDFDTDEQLRKALETSSIGKDPSVNERCQSKKARSLEDEYSSTDSEYDRDDWVLKNFDPETTEPQCMVEECKRLQVLKSYLILDSESEEEFERITRIAARVFDVPIALVSLMDLGRQFFMSNYGLPPEVKEMSRGVAMCAHVVQAKLNSPKIYRGMNKEEQERALQLHPMVIVPDTKEDFRFCNFATVLNSPFVRFYVGTSLVSPEGYTLGTLCIVDTKPRPQGFTLKEMETLQDLAAMVMNLMVTRRSQKLALTAKVDRAQSIASTAHELMTPLTGVQISLALLSDDEELKSMIGPHRSELLSTASMCSHVLQRICKQSIDSLRSDVNDDKAMNQSLSGSTGKNTTQMGSTVMEDLVGSLRMIMDPVQKAVPIIITLDKSVPPVIEADDLKLFRSALNLISNAVKRTSSGSIHLRIFIRDPQQQQNSTQSMIVFECEDTGKDVDADRYMDLFQPGQRQYDESSESEYLGVEGVASLVASMGGECSFRPRGLSEDGKVIVDARGRRKQGSIFWFSLPINLHINHVQIDDGSATSEDHLHNESRETSYSQKQARHPATILPRPASTPLLSTSCEFNVMSKALLFQQASRAESSMSQCYSIGNLKNRKPVRFGSWQEAETIRTSCFGAVFEPIVTSTCSIDSNNDILALSNDSHEPSLHRNDSNFCMQVDTESLEASKAFEYLLSRSNETKSFDKIHNFFQKEKDPIMSVNRVSPVPINELGDTENMMKHERVIRDVALIHDTRLEPTTLTNYNEPSNVPNATNQASDGSVKLRSRRALVIDDSLIIRKSLHRALTKIGFEVVLAENGLEGLNEMKAQIFDLVLCDFLMPVMDGLDCVKQYREWEEVNRPFFQQLIVGMSAHANVKDSGQGIQVGMDAFKPKPITIQILTELQKWDLLTVKSKQLDEEMSKQTQMKTGNCRDREMLHLDSSNADQLNDCFSKRRCRESACLVASSFPLDELKVLTSSLREFGCSVVVVQNGSDALQMLKSRNWDIVLIDDDITAMDGSVRSCILEFRAWEEKNRINGQKNVFMVCDGDIPSPQDASFAFIQPPAGCNGVFRKPLPWNDLLFVLNQNGLRNGVVGMDIILH